MPTELDTGSILEIGDVRKSFGGNHVLRGVSFSLPRTSVTALIGSNGAGKSTVLNILSGLFPADSGVIRLNGKDLNALPCYQRARAGLGRTFQHPRTFQTFTVLDAVMLAQTQSRAEGLLHSIIWTVLSTKSGMSQARARAEFCLEKCKLLNKANTLAAALTYGEKKLLMMAQAVAFGSELLCLDELCAGLEPALIDQVGELVLELSRDGKTLLFVEHNLELVRKISSQCIFLHDGIVHREGPTGKVLSDPDVVSLYLGD